MGRAPSRLIRGWDAGWAALRRPGGGPGAAWAAVRRHPGNLVGSLVIVAIVLGMSVGLPALNRALPAARPVATDRPYLVDTQVTVVPPAGAALDVTNTRPYADRGVVLFLVRGVRYVLTAVPFSGGLDEATAQLRRKITANRGYQITGQEVPVRTAAGVPGRQGGYTSPGRVGQYAVYLYNGTAVEVTIAGADPDVHAALPDLQRSVASLNFLLDQE